MTDLSLQAQAVLDALYMEELNGPQQLMACAHAAAALRAAVEQLGFELQLDDLSGTVLHIVSVNTILAVANELEQYNDQTQAR